MIKIQEEVLRIGDYVCTQGRNGEYYIYYQYVDDKNFVASADNREEVDKEIEDIERQKQEASIEVNTNVDDKHKYAWYLAYTNKKYDGKAEFLNFDGTVTKKHYLDADYMTEKEKNTISRIYYNNHPNDKRLFLNYIE